MTEVNRLADYLPLIGRVTIAAATLEEIALVNVMALSKESPDETRYKYMIRGLGATLDRLSELVTDRVSPHYRQKVIDLIEEARQLKNKRNENVHGVWAEMVMADTMEFVQVNRSRYERDKATKSVAWVLKTPSIEELDKLCKELEDVAHRLEKLMDSVWNIDEDVVSWRMRKGV